MSSPAKEASQGTLDNSTSPLPKDNERVRSGGTDQGPLQSDNSLGEEDGESATRNRSGSDSASTSYLLSRELPRTLL